MTDHEIVPTLLHASKGRLLSALRTCPVDFDSRVRVTADSDSPEVLRLVAMFSNYRDTVGQRSSNRDDEHATDKHKMLWLLPLSDLEKMMGTSATSSLGEANLWQYGTLHVIESAPEGLDYQ